jgi:hypothetical protein
MMLVFFLDSLKGFGHNFGWVVVDFTAIGAEDEDLCSVQGDNLEDAFGSFYKEPV